MQVDPRLVGARKSTMLTPTYSHRSTRRNFMSWSCSLWAVITKLLTSLSRLGNTDWGPLWALVYFTQNSLWDLIQCQGREVGFGFNIMGAMESCSAETWSCLVCKDFAPWLQNGDRIGVQGSPFQPSSSKWSDTVQGTVGSSPPGPEGRKPKLPLEQSLSLHPSPAASVYSSPFLLGWWKLLQLSELVMNKLWKGRSCIQMDIRAFLSA